MADLESIITSAVTESGMGDLSTPEPETDTVETELEAQPEGTEAPIEEPTAEVTQEDAPADPAAPVAPVAAKPTAEEDEFSKKHGLQAREPNGRENRIPYSRVKKITENAVKEAQDTWSKEKDFVVKERDGWKTTATDYHQRLQRVVEFEQAMVQDKPGFLRWLAQSVPGYAEVFQQLITPSAPPNPYEGMPGPDQDMADGSKVYSEDGLRKLLDYVEEKVTKKVTSQVENRYKPIETEWQAQQRLQQMLPRVQKTIDEARQWPMFKENEEDITKALVANQGLSLEGAYRQVVFPKIQAERESMRTQILSEIKKAPTATAAPVRASKPAAVAPKKATTLEELIQQQVDAAKEQGIR